jgi:NAD(P)-dependent dehydrogenase (short-subunit alcohol dehydrogenase family)
MNGPGTGNQLGAKPAEGPTISDLFSMAGRVVLITGGSKGLGRSIARGLSEAGATTVVASRDADDCRAVAAELAAATDTESVGEQLDVTDEADVARVFSGIVDRFGRLDAVVNSAGVNVRQPLEACPLEDFERVLDVNLVGTWLCCREAGRVMRPAGRGCVVNLGSALSAIGMPSRVPYCSSKAGVIGLTQAVALEWAGSGLRCNALCPGPFLTDMNLPLLADPERAAGLVGRTALNRWAELSEIRGPALFLASEASSYVTGAALYVDGGWTAQ